MNTQESEATGDLQVCDKCAFTTRVRQALYTHIRTMHNRLECHLCDYSTISDVWLREHVKRHEEQRYRCPDCDFASDSYRKMCGHTVDRHQKVFGGADMGNAATEKGPFTYDVLYVFGTLLLASLTFHWHNRSCPAVTYYKQKGAIQSDGVGL